MSYLRPPCPLLTRDADYMYCLYHSDYPSRQIPPQKESVHNGYIATRTPRRSAHTAQLARDERNGPPSCSLAPDYVFGLGATSCADILLETESLCDAPVRCSACNASVLSRWRIVVFVIPPFRAGRRLRTDATLSLLLPDYVSVILHFAGTS